jgi:TrmH family RNA methyltransferase
MTRTEGRAFLPILSAQNAKFKLWQSLNTSKGIRENNLCLASGLRVAEEWLKAAPADLPLTWLINDARASDFVAAIDQLERATGPRPNSTIFSLSSELFRELDSSGTGQPISVCEIQPPTAWNAETHKAQGLELIVPASEPTNLGAVIRSSVAFAVSKIILPSESANPFLPKSIRSSSGAVFTAHLFSAPDIETTVEESMSSNVDLVALDASGTNIAEHKWSANTRLILGEEGRGLPSSLLLDSRLKKISIPIQFESLNIAVAAGIALHSYRSKWVLQK